MRKIITAVSFAIALVPAISSAQYNVQINGFACAPAVWSTLTLVRAYKPYVSVDLTDDYGHRWYVKTDWRGEWWVDDLPSARTYHVFAVDDVPPSWFGYILGGSPTSRPSLHYNFYVPARKYPWDWWKCRAPDLYVYR